MAKKNTEETILDVQEVYTKTELFVEDNKKTLLVVVVGIAVLVLAYIMFDSFVAQPAVANANEEAHMAEMYFMMDSLDVSRTGTDLWDGLDYIAENHAGTPVGMRASYQLGVINRDAGDFQEALENFKAADFDSPLLGAMVNGNIGDCLVEIGASYEDGADADGKYTEALPYFKKAAGSSSDEITTQIYYNKAANVCLKLGMYSEAVKMYDGIIDATTNIRSAEYKDALKMRAFALAKAAK